MAAEVYFNTIVKSAIDQNALWWFRALPKICRARELFGDLGSTKSLSERGAAPSRSRIVEERGEIFKNFPTGSVGGNESGKVNLRNTALFRWLFSLLLPASEANSYMVPFITSAYSTNLLLPYRQSDRLRPQKFNKSQSFVPV